MVKEITALFIEIEEINKDKSKLNFKTVNIPYNDFSKILKKDYIHCEMLDVVTVKINDIDYDIYCDDDGITNSNTPVYYISDDQVLFGNLIITRNVNFDIGSLTEDDIENLKADFIQRRKKVIKWINNRNKK